MERYVNLFNRVVHFDGASGFGGYIESVEMYNYYKSIPSGLNAARMTYDNMNKSKSVEFFHVEMASRTGTALDQLNHSIDATFSSIRKFEPFDQYTTLQSLYTALDHQLQDGLMGQQESDRMRFIVGKLWDLNLQIHMIEKECAQPSDVIEHVISLMLHLYLEDIITGPLFVYVCTHLYSR